MNKYQTLHGIEYLNRYPWSGEKLEIKWAKADSAPLLNIYVLKDVFLYATGIVIGKDKITIKDSIMRDTHINLLLNQIAEDYKERDYIKLDGEYVSLLGPWSNGFWHWMMEFLYKVIMAETSGFTGQYIVLQGQHGFVLESLEMLGVMKERILLYDINKSVLVERLFVPERVRTGYDDKFLFLLNQVRTNLLDGIPVQNTNRKRVYISRKHATNGRRIVNEAELIQLLEQYNFETVIMEHKSLKDQIGLMANAGWLIGANGAGIVHCLFMPEASFITLIKQIETTFA